MAQVTIVYWRDMPAQVLVGRGRRGVKIQLSERFEQAIDRAAMASGAAGTDEYLVEWRKADPVSVEGSDQEAAEAKAAEIEAEFDQEHLKKLISNNGWA